MELAFKALLIVGCLLGLAMGLGRLRQRIGCAALCTVPFILFAMISIEPLLTGERQSSTAALAIPFGTLWVALSASVGVLAGVVGRWLSKR